MHSQWQFLNQQLEGRNREAVTGRRGTECGWAIYNEVNLRGKRGKRGKPYVHVCTVEILKSGF